MAVVTLEEVKKALRISEETLLYDQEIQALISSATSELIRIGVRREVLEDTSEYLSSLAKQATILYAKAYFGYDNPEAERFEKSFRRLAIDLANSEANTALYSEGGGSDEIR